jgi:hypothetical protein
MRAVAIYVNDGPEVRGTFDVQVEQVETTGASKKDLSWQFTDTAGHYHAWADDGSLPTLVRRDEYVTDPDEGDDFGYTAIHLHCRICDEEVQPHWVPSLFREFAPGRKSWTVTVETYVEVRGQVSVRVLAGDCMFFGVAEAVSGTVSGGPGPGHLACTTLVGIGELGQRKAPAVVSR